MLGIFVHFELLNRGCGFSCVRLYSGVLNCTNDCVSRFVGSLCASVYCVGLPLIWFWVLVLTLDAAVGFTVG